MSESDPRRLKQMFRFAMENSDNTKPTEMDPERAEWLKEALASASVDLTKQLKEDITLLSQLLPKAHEQPTECEAVLEDILNLTEDLDLANDFFRLGGTDLLLELVFRGPESLKSHSYQLLANVTQNNPEAQKICVQHSVVSELVALLPRERDLKHLKKLLLALSCLTRGYPPAVADFRKVNGFEAVLAVIQSFASQSEAEPVCNKGAFLVFCLLQDVITSSMDENEAKRLTSAITSLCLRLPHANEHLLASLIMLFTDSPSVDVAIDVENVPDQSTKRAGQFLDKQLVKPFMDWLLREDEQCSKSQDAAHAEVHSYIGVLQCILNKA